MNESATLEERWQACLAGHSRQQLLEAVGAVFQRAIEARAPRNRPPGKAGLRAEKGYYRMLYLEEEYSARAFSGENRGPKALPLAWEQMAAILRQLEDIPELHEEIEAGIVSALDTVQEGGGRS